MTSWISQAGFPLITISPNLVDNQFDIHQEIYLYKNISDTNRVERDK